MCLICAVSSGSHSTGPELLPWLAKTPRQLLIVMIVAYRRFISPFSPPSCRFTPTCSRYAIDALRRYGAFAGTWLALWRLLRCNPFHRGGYDPLR